MTDQKTSITFTVKRSMDADLALQDIAKLGGIEAMHTLGQRGYQIIADMDQAERLMRDISAMKCIENLSGETLEAGAVPDPGKKLYAYAIVVGKVDESDAVYDALFSLKGIFNVEAVPHMVANDGPDEITFAVFAHHDADIDRMEREARAIKGVKYTDFSATYCHP